MTILDWIPKAYAATAAETATTAAEKKGIAAIYSFVFENIGNWVIGIIIVIITVILAKMASNAVREAILRSKGEEVQENALLLVERMTRVGILAIGISIALAINGLNFTAIVGAISLGIGFALKSFVENFMSSVIMLSQNRIRIGDLVDINGFMGRIVSIDMRTTVIQQLDGPMVTIPNQTMLSSVWTSYSANPLRRMELIVGVTYETDLQATTSIIKGVISKYPDIATKPEPSIMVDSFEDSSVDIKIWFWVESSKPFLMIRSNLANRILKAFEKAGISMPYPIRTLRIDQDDPAILKTMDNLKKGVIPEPRPIPTKELMAEAAASTENLEKIPMNVFEIPKPAVVPVTDPSNSAGDRK